MLKLGGRQEGRLAERGKGLSRLPRDTGWGNAFFFLQPSRAELYPWPYRPRVGKTRLGHIRILVFGRAKCRPSIIQQRPFTRLSLPNLSIEPPLRFFFFRSFSLPRDYPWIVQGRSIRIIYPRMLMEESMR